MDFLGVGPLELLFIIIIALIVIGPRDMAKTARAAGRFLNRLYRSDTWRTLTQASRTLRNLPNRLARDAALEELKDVEQDIRDTTGTIAEDIGMVDQDLKAWPEPPEASPGTQSGPDETPATASEIAEPSTDAASPDLAESPDQVETTESIHPPEG